MSCLGKLSFFFLQGFIFILISLGAIKGLQYMASESYSPGDSPHIRFMFAVADQKESGDVKQSYDIYQWKSLGEIKSHTPTPVFFLSEPKVVFQDREGAHVTLKILTREEHEQEVEVRWIGQDEEIISRYRVTQKEIIPLYFRRVTLGLAKRGYILGLIATFLSAVPLYRFLARAEEWTA